MGRVSKGTKCSVVDCGEKAVRSLSSKRVSSAGLEVGRAGRVYLCEAHYKEFKKKIRNARRVERWRWRA